ncbi:hypothetical protein CCAX7_12560 [Capsulimonas corticalis]|uniref:Uncharacterized protein n=2 Tax=Capsulimonas corticalis TaxID=2219043 RepID=A0A402D4F1_9BACT|nr:hypothetical protein CCAX7_12560 [Capsulimonas corticalis]
MPIASRLLARSDEAWLFQTAVKLRLVETHLALMSPHDIVQVDHLMMAVKLHKTEIDAIFLAHEGPVTRPQPILVTCEVKGKRDDILEDQIISQTEAASKIINIGHKYIIPIAMKAVGLSEIYVVEFEKVHISSAATLTSLIVSSEATYKLIPTVPGIGK